MLLFFKLTFRAKREESLSNVVLVALNKNLFIACFSALKRDTSLRSVLIKKPMSEITKAIQAICDEKNLEYDAVLESIEAALAAAYRKDYGNRQQNIKVKFTPETGDMQAWDIKEVVKDVDEEKLEADQEELVLRREKAREENRDLTEEEVEDLTRFNPKTELMISEAKEVKKKVKVGEILEIVLEIPGDFGRMAAQTAKQVIIQRLREAERSSVYDDLKEQEGEVIQGVVQRRDRAGSIIIDLGKVTGLVSQNEQIRGEQYKPGVRMRFYLQSIEMGARGVEINLSRSSKKMVESTFVQEIPEIESGAVEIKGIARDPGFRSKVAVSTEDDSIDPIGACIGQRGSRINIIIDELGGEKIDIIQYSENPEEYLKNSLSPAKIDSVEINEESKEAIVNVAEDQFSLAIGRGGQNVRLSAELTGWTIKVMEAGGEKAVSSEDETEEVKEVLDGEEKKGEEDKEVKEDKEVVESVEKEKKPKKKATKKKAKKEKENTDDTEVEEGTESEEKKAKTEDKKEEKGEKTEE